MTSADLQPLGINYFEHRQHSNVEILDELGAKRRNLAEMRRLVYALYTDNQQPLEVPTHLSGQRPLTQYIVAGLPSEGLVKSVPKNLLQFDGGQSLEKFNTTGGFFGIEIAQSPNEFIEAQSLFNWDKWTDLHNQRIAYLSDFSPHPRLSHSGKIEVLRNLFNTCQKILTRHFIDKTYIVLAPNIHNFVEETSKAKLESCDAPYNEMAVSQLKELFPKYWQQNPQLYILKF